MIADALRCLLAVILDVPTYFVVVPLLLACRLCSFLVLDIPTMLSARSCRGGGEKRSPMRAEDSFMLMETKTNHCNIVAVIELAAPAFSIERLRSVVERAFVSSAPQAGAQGVGDALVNIGPKWPRFGQRPLCFCTRWFWEDMGAAFDLSQHVWEKRLGPDDGPFPLEAFLAELQSAPMNRSRPLWDAVLVHHPGATAGTSTVAFRLHHAMGDGISLMRVLLEGMEHDPSPASDPAAVGHRSAGGFTRAAFTLLYAPLLAVEQVLQAKDQSSLKPRALQGSKCVAFSPPVEFARVRAAARAHGSTVTALVSACFARGIAGLGPDGLGSADSGAGADKGGRPLKFWVPVSLSAPKDGDAEMRNDLCYLMMPLACNAASTVAALGEANKSLQELKTSYQAPALLWVLRAAMVLFPNWFATVFLNWIGDKGTGVLSSVPGPRTPLRFGGQQVTSFRFLVPQRSGVAVGLSAVSYAGSFQVGVSTDAAALSAPQRLVEGWGRAFAELEAEADKVVASA